MANIPAFNAELDKITEREVVYDFVSRLKIGKSFTDPDNESTIIFDPPTKLKDIMRKAVMALPTTIALNLDEIHTTYINIQANNEYNEISIVFPSKTTLLLAYSERTQTDLTSLFTPSENNTKYTMTIDVPYENTDIIKFYYTI